MLKVITNKAERVTVLKGQFYQHVDITDSLYFVTDFWDGDDPKYGLVNIKSGEFYANPKKNIDEIFASSDHKFILVKDVTITVTH